MHVLFDRSHVTVRNVQVRRCCPRLVTGLYWMVTVLSVDVPLALDLLSLTDVDLPD